MWDGIATTLRGELVTLEPIDERHAEGLRAAAAHDEIWTWLAPGLADRARFDSWFTDARRALAEGREAPFATIDRTTGEAIGSTRFMALRPEHRSLEIGWTWLSPSAWRGGANVEAKLLMLGHAFETLGCVRVELKTDARNERSRAAMAALPAQFEGIHRQHMVLPVGGLRDSAWYSVIDAEWPAVRASLRRRLAARRGS